MAQPASKLSRPTTPLFVADGNHRFQAHKRNGDKTIDAYVVVGASYAAITTLTFLANAKHGLPTSEADRMEQAKHLVNSGVPVDKAARMLSLSANKLRHVVNLAELDMRAKEVGVNVQEWTRLPGSIRTALGRITTDDGFESMTKLTIDAGLRAEAVGEAVDHLKGLRTSDKQKEFVAALRKTFSRDLQVAGTRVNSANGAEVVPRVGQGKNPRTILAMRLGGVSGLPAIETVVAAIHREERHEWIERINDAMSKLTAIKAALAEK